MYSKCYTYRSERCAAAHTVLHNAHECSREDTKTLSAHTLIS
jgi:hypothetical protein